MCRAGSRFKSALCPRSTTTARLPFAAFFSLESQRVSIDRKAQRISLSLYIYTHIHQAFLPGGALHVRAEGGGWVNTFLSRTSSDRAPFIFNKPPPPCLRLLLAFPLPQQAKIKTPEASTKLTLSDLVTTLNYVHVRKCGGGGEHRPALLGSQSLSCKDRAL